MKTLRIIHPLDFFNELCLALIWHGSSDVLGMVGLKKDKQMLYFQWKWAVSV